MNTAKTLMAVAVLALAGCAGYPNSTNYPFHQHTNYLGGTDVYWDGYGNRMLVYPDGSRMYTYFNPATGEFSTRAGNMVMVGNARTGSLQSNF
jgi:hypothetical protein